jgi:hypothetical protein
VLFIRAHFKRSTEGKGFFESPVSRPQRVRLALACRTLRLLYTPARTKLSGRGEVFFGGVSGVGGVKIGLTAILSRMRIHVRGRART